MNRSSVDSIKFGSEDAVETVKAVVECLSFAYERTADRHLEKSPACIHSCMVRVV
jgi:hypothetical protein